MAGRGVFVMLGICTAILLAAAMAAAQSIFAPIVFALFVIALAWPVQGALQPRLGALPALLATLIVTLCVLALLGLMIAWAFGGVVTWVIGNGGRFAELYAQKLTWLAAQGIAPGLLSERFDVRWLVGVAQGVSVQLNALLTFLVVTFVFALLGLLEVGVVQRQLASLGPTGEALLRGAIETGRKFRTYMLVRTLMSAVTGLAVYAFALAMGLDLAAEWGVIAFVMNYIPFIGSLVATLFPTIFAILQFGSAETAIAVFLVLNVIQFTTGSYIEPRLAGRQLAVSPFLVLAAVFFGAFLWGVPGAFIGVPVLIAAITLCEQFDGTRPVADLLAGRELRR